MLSGDMIRDRQSTVFSQHSYGVSEVARRRAEVKLLLCFRLGLIFSDHLAIEPGLRETKALPGGLDTYMHWRGVSCDYVRQWAVLYITNNIYVVGLNPTDFIFP